MAAPRPDIAEADEAPARLEAVSPPAQGAARDRNRRSVALLLPAGALLFLLAGGIAWAVDAGAWATRIWFTGLVLTGASPVWRTLRSALRGHFATDLVATLVNVITRL